MHWFTSQPDVRQRFLYSFLGVKIRVWGKSRGYVECPRNTRIPGIRPGRRIPGILVGIVSSPEVEFSDKLSKSRPGIAT